MQTGVVYILYISCFFFIIFFRPHQFFLGAICHMNMSYAILIYIGPSARTHVLSE